MKITLTGEKGRSVITNSLEVPNRNHTEEDIQDIFISFVDFLDALGVDLPDEILEMVDEHLSEDD